MSAGSALDKRPGWLAALVYAGAGLLMLLALGPAVWLVGVALADASVPMSRLPMPSEMPGANFRGAWEEGGLFRALINSVIVTVAQAVLNVVLAGLAAYPLARMDFPGRGTIFVLILATIMVPESRVFDVWPGQPGELAAAALPGQKLAFEVQRVHPVAEVADQTNVFPVKVRLTGRVGQDPDAAFDPPAWVRPGVEGVAKADAGRKPWIWLWVRDGVNWVRMKLWW